MKSASTTVGGDKPRRLLVVTSSIHYSHNGSAYAYGPYAREIDAWADLFERVEIAAPVRYCSPPGDCLEFARPNISLRPQLATGGKTLAEKAKQVLSLPRVVSMLAAAMRDADAIHVRCPGNLGLLGVMLAPLFSRYRIAKYAGQWNGYDGERLSVWAQRRLLGSDWWAQPVTVYGEWPSQPRHVKSFFTSMMATEHVEKAVRVAETKQIGQPLRILFSGRLAPEKRVDALLRAIEHVMVAGVRIEVVIVGDGTERTKLEKLAQELGLAAHVRFVGAMPFEEGLAWYEWAHCLVLPSVHSEGWPKVLAEAMCHGLACIAVRHGQIPRMLQGRGVLLDEGSPQEIADALLNIANSPDDFRAKMRAASMWSRQYSLEGLRDELAELLTREWSVPIEVRYATANVVPRDHEHVERCCEPHPDGVLAASIKEHR